MKIYDFSMNLVDSFDCDNINSYENLECSWDGRNKNNIKVANGVYFARLNFSNSPNGNTRDFWDKFIVIK